MAKTLEELREELGECTRCSLCRGRNNIVFGDGNPDAQLMFVGEAPGRAEDAQGLPFVGPAGKLLDRLLEDIGLKRGDTYIANVIKCRPPGNRDPLPEETEACSPFLQEQTEIIRPRILCALGRVAAGFMMGKSVQITRIHGQRFEGAGYFLVPVLHPAAALRAASNMDLIRQDFKSLEAYLAEDDSPPEPPAEEPEQMGLF
ncbi:MAG: uracil-DNA glycosylase [Actinobacteria bacterium]|nr:uracil-DNA glycosylase [Actinomycetota bacterium]MCG2819656.1 uracil-DNA glycosylase [Actinomycetes bacterium]MBU4217378.1 uracil-DNA glycosylase [Actinomycetota bacterium]MBU4359940.1 uracil-DNA glycosylase [Actinomycetota bacterium]MBU4393138.1 uracil-DNA glycosylase [Actinomycetota bacterium]